MKTRVLLLLSISFSSCTFIEKNGNLDGTLMAGPDLSVTIGPITYNPTNSRVTFTSITISNTTGSYLNGMPLSGYFVTMDDFIGNYDDVAMDISGFSVSVGPTSTMVLLNQSWVLDCPIPLNGFRGYFALDIFQQYSDSKYANNVAGSTNRIYPTLVAPLGLMMATNSNGNISLSWYSNALAQGYSVYRSMDNTTTYSNIGSNSTTFLTDTLPLLDHNYYYKIASYSNGVATPASDDFLVINSYGKVLDSPGLAFYAWGNSLVWGTDGDWPGVGILGSCRSPRIQNHQASSLQTVVNGTNISFYWKSSGYYDEYLVFFIDGAEMARISGNVSWRKTNFTLTAGDHTVKWSYIIESESDYRSFYNAVWFDYVKVIP